ncbi:MAG: LamG domain-containing protein, partial [Bacteroidota bacterium]
MKKTLPILILALASSHVFGQFIQGVNITPQNPTSNDTIRVVATGFLPSSGCDNKNITISQQGSQININALHCMGLLTTICNVSDTVFLPPLSAGTYTLNFTLAGGFLPAPCVASGQTASNTISFNVSSVSQPANDNALDFDGVDDFVSAPSASNLIAGSSNFSMSMWVYPRNAFPSYPDFDGFGGFRDDFAGDFYLLQLSGTDVEARFRNSTGTPYTMVYSGLQLNTWQHFVLTYDGSNMVLYHNGSQVISTPANGIISNTVNPFYIGKAPFTNAPFNLNGKVDEVSLWNKTLSQQEIDCIYSSGINPTATNLQLYYKCNQGTAGGNNSS